MHQTTELQKYIKQKLIEMEVEIGIVTIVTGYFNTHLSVRDEICSKS